LRKNLNEIRHPVRLNLPSSEIFSFAQTEKTSRVALLWCKEYQPLQTAPLSERSTVVSTSFSTKLLKIIQCDDDCRGEYSGRKKFFLAIGIARATQRGSFVAPQNFSHMRRTRVHFELSSD
jgi:hypothetical protein